MRTGAKLLLLAFGWIEEWPVADRKGRDSGLPSQETLHMMSPRLVATLFCASALCASPFAQKAPSKKERQESAEKKRQAILEKKRKEIRERIRDARSRMRRGEYVESHVRVRVKLRNGERLEGVVKNGRFVERPAGLEFIRSEMKVKGAGLRIFYYNGTVGYIFIPYRSIETYRVLKLLTDLEVKSIHDSMKEKEAEARRYAEKRREEIKKRADAHKLKTAKKSALTAEQKAAAERAKIEAEQKRLLALVDEFPPSKGWNAEKIAELKRRAIIINVYPNKKERRFMDVFDDWKKGLALKELVKQEGKKAGKPEPGIDPADDPSARVEDDPYGDPASKGFDPVKPKEEPGKKSGSEKKPGSSPGFTR
ncbi:MAG: hypothetical protein CSA62_12980 [Planctomycetota bacterium]|nr:MAG: hypothetical protein CSA62_12980 [Planctomycetota bacterium]